MTDFFLAVLAGLLIYIVLAWVFGGQDDPDDSE
jgi:hypothetical protein